MHCFPNESPIKCTTHRSCLRLGNAEPVLNFQPDVSEHVRLFIYTGAQAKRHKIPEYAGHPFFDLRTTEEGYACPNCLLCLQWVTPEHITGNRHTNRAAEWAYWMPKEMFGRFSAEQETRILLEQHPGTILEYETHPSGAEYKLLPPKWPTERTICAQPNRDCRSFPPGLNLDNSKRLRETTPDDTSFENIIKKLYTENEHMRTKMQTQQDTIAKLENKIIELLQSNELTMNRDKAPTITVHEKKTQQSANNVSELPFQLETNNLNAEDKSSTSSKSVPSLIDGDFYFA